MQIVFLTECTFILSYFSLTHLLVIFLCIFWEQEFLCVVGCSGIISILHGCSELSYHLIKFTFDVVRDVELLLTNSICVASLKKMMLFV